MVRTVVETNVIGVIRVTNAMLPLLRRSTSPRIVNVSSAVASLTRQADLNAVTVQYARQFAGTNILINAACPGLVATDFTGFQGPQRSGSPRCPTAARPVRSSRTTASSPGDPEPVVITP